MTKRAFLADLSSRLSGLPQAEVETQINFFSEMIDDYVEEGFSEEEAIAKIGPVDAIARSIAASVSGSSRETTTPKPRTNPMVITLLILGSPIWLSLVISIFAVLISVLASLWAAVLSVLAVPLSTAVCAFAVPLAGIFFLFSGHLHTGIAAIGAGFVLAGISIYLYFTAKAAVKGAWFLTKNLFAFVYRILPRRRTV